MVSFQSSSLLNINLYSSLTVRAPAHNNALLSHKYSTEGVCIMQLKRADNKSIENETVIVDVMSNTLLQFFSFTVLTHD